MEGRPRDRAQPSRPLEISPPLSAFQSNDREGPGGKGRGKAVQRTRTGCLFHSAVGRPTAGPPAPPGETPGPPAGPDHPVCSGLGAGARVRPTRTRTAYRRQRSNARARPALHSPPARAGRSLRPEIPAHCAPVSAAIHTWSTHAAPPRWIPHSAYSAGRPGGNSPRTARQCAAGALTPAGPPPAAPTHRRWAPTPPARRPIGAGTRPQGIWSLPSISHPPAAQGADPREASHRRHG